jgi:hypothetical protein
MKTKNPKKMMKMKKNLLQRKLLVKVKVLHKKIRRLMMILLKTKAHHQVKKLKVKLVVNQVKKLKKAIKKPILLKMIMLKMKVNHQQRKPKANMVVKLIKPIKIQIQNLTMVIINNNFRQIFY